MKTDRELQQEEVDKNYEIFKKQYKNILNDYHGKRFILMSNGKVIAGFENWNDSIQSGRMLFKNKERFSIQEIESQPINLGYQSYAVI